MTVNCTPFFTLLPLRLPAKDMVVFFSYEEGREYRT